MELSPSELWCKTVSLVPVHCPHSWVITTSTRTPLQFYVILQPFVHMKFPMHIHIFQINWPYYKHQQKAWNMAQFPFFFCQLQKTLQKMGSNLFPLTSHQAFPDPRSPCPLLLLTSPLCLLWFCCQAPATDASYSSPNSSFLTSSCMPPSMEFVFLWFAFVSSFAVKLLPWFVLLWSMLPFLFLCDDP